ncbi:MAG: hypothetical protein ACK5WO_01555 [Cyclobacteriaceae bacterium]|jgi:hypothetical protein
MEKDLITPAQLKKLCTLLSQQQLEDEVIRKLVFDFSNGRCTSRKLLYKAEALELIDQLEHHDSNSKMRRKVFAIWHDLGKLYPGLNEVNAALIDRFLLTRGAIKIPLAKQSHRELVQTVSQMEKYQKNVKKQNDAKAKALVDGLLVELGLKVD